MLLDKKRRLGKQLEELSVGESIQLTERIEDKDLLLYLGLTNDNNPLYIQHDYAASTAYEKPVVPTIMLTGIVTSAISKHLPGAGSYICAQTFHFPTPLYHYETVQIQLTVENIDTINRQIKVKVEGLNSKEEIVLEGTVTAIPPIHPK
ncbi:enoyl-CoA hydratase [Rummeliibacillus sp. TYF005]|uniref:MaoC/PaaZ C-terminal domain-containing protein n=1 Tax=unclassified Rummeliibacillus TaxID=2622809 RepID=UPI000E6760CD|nr:MULTISPECIES: MaoC/PaaZ C-terminal domain-containing protein [unclassified Rummeliibacillus]RIJ63239.1 enoyl-CoA hydratase [Rummeliibacillus sp. POC4]RPJ94181.1 enoyl-CoA hydratase [Rummeliibacillus sp. TYF005]